MLGVHARSRQQSGPVAPSFNWTDPKKRPEGTTERAVQTTEIGQGQTVHHSNATHKTIHVTGKETKAADLCPVSTARAKGHTSP